MKTLVGFDLFGTLLEIPEFDPISWLTTKHPELISKKSIIEHIYLTASFEYFANLFDNSSNEIRQDIVEMNSKLYSQARESTVYEDTFDILTYLRQKGIATFLISNICEVHSSVIDLHGLSAYFDYITLSWKCGIRKPDIRIFQEAIRIFSGDDRKVFFIGDSLEDDILGSYNAGIEPIYLNRGSFFKNVNIGYTTIKQLIELENIFGNNFV